MPTFAARLLRFLTGFPLPPALPDAVQAESPYRDLVALDLLTKFAGRYYADNQPRVAVLGINPGRLGGGRTGIAFTDPGALTQFCGIAHTLPKKAPELSSAFVYQVVMEMGGPAAFYQHFYLGSVYPLTLLRNDLNYNYYDAPALTTALWADMQLSLRQQVEELDIRADLVVCLGKRNGLFLNKLNDELQLFGRVVVLDHPRYLMQYQRKNLSANVAKYVQALGEAAGL
jgi:hypothetical protein